MYDDVTINEFQQYLTSYNATLSDVTQERTEIDVIYDRDARVRCQLEFSTVRGYKQFVIDLAILGNRIHAERKLHDQYPELKEAYEHYQTLVKLYGG